MIDPYLFYSFLKKNGVDFFSGVPDSLLKEFCKCLEDNENQNHIISTNEGSAIALAIGNHLSTKKIPLVYLQNSGFGNIINPLVSLADQTVYSVPMFIVVGWRGEPNSNDEPQHIKQGEITETLTKVLNYPYEILSSDFESAKTQCQTLLKTSIKNKTPVILLVKKGTFKSYSSKNILNENNNIISREEFIENIVSCLEKEDLVISTTGKASRELFEIRKNNKEINNDFLTVGGMGHANQIALGIALAKKEKSIYCIDGDGAALMHMGGIALIGNLKPKNFCHILINNQSHESVGGQPTIGNKLDFSSVAKSFGYKESFRIFDINDLKNRLKAFKKDGGPFFLELMSSINTRKSLGRPSKTPLENKISFIKKIQD